MHSDSTPPPIPAGWTTDRSEWTLDPQQKKWFRWVANRQGVWHRLYYVGSPKTPWSGKSWELWCQQPTSTSTSGLTWATTTFPCEQRNVRSWWANWMHPTTLACLSCRRCAQWPQCAKWPCTDCQVCESWPRCKNTRRYVSLAPAPVSPSPVVDVKSAEAPATKSSGSSGRVADVSPPADTLATLSAVSSVVSVAPVMGTQAAQGALRGQMGGEPQNQGGMALEHPAPLTGVAGTVRSANMDMNASLASGDMGFTLMPEDAVLYDEEYVDDGEEMRGKSIADSDYFLVGGAVPTTSGSSTATGTVPRTTSSGSGATLPIGTPATLNVNGSDEDDDDDSDDEGNEGDGEGDEQESGAPMAQMAQRPPDAPRANSIPLLAPWITIEPPPSQSQVDMQTPPPMIAGSSFKLDVEIQPPSQPLPQPLSQAEPQPQLQPDPHLLQPQSLSNPGPVVSTDSIVPPTAPIDNPIVTTAVPIPMETPTLPLAVLKSDANSQTCSDSSCQLPPWRSDAVPAHAQSSFQALEIPASKPMPLPAAQRKQDAKRLAGEGAPPPRDCAATSLGCVNTNMPRNINMAPTWSACVSQFGSRFPCPCECTCGRLYECEISRALKCKEKHKHRSDKSGKSAKKKDKHDKHSKHAHKKSRKHKKH